MEQTALRFPKVPKQSEPRKWGSLKWYGGEDSPSVLRVLKTGVGANLLQPAASRGPRCPIRQDVRGPWDITESSAFDTYSSVLQLYPPSRAQLPNSSCITRSSTPPFIRDSNRNYALRRRGIFQTPDNYLCENSGLASQVGPSPGVCSITAFLRGITNEDPLTTRNNLPQRTRARL